MTYTCENCAHSYTKEIEKLAPQIIEQNKDTVKEWSKDENLTFRSNASYEDFIEVRINGTVLSSDLYTIREGSIIVDLKPEYLASLKNGDYRLEIVSVGGVAATDFSVNKNIMTNPWVWGSGTFVLVAGLLAFAVWWVFFKKKWLILQLGTLQTTNILPKTKKFFAGKASKNDAVKKADTDKKNNSKPEKTSIGINNSSQNTTAVDQTKDSHN